MAASSPSAPLPFSIRGDTITFIERAAKVSVGNVKADGDRLSNFPFADVVTSLTALSRTRRIHLCAPNVNSATITWNNDELALSFGDEDSARPPRGIKLSVSVSGSASKRSLRPDYAVSGKIAAKMNMLQAIAVLLWEEAVKRTTCAHLWHHGPFALNSKDIRVRMPAAILSHAAVMMSNVLTALFGRESTADDDNIPAANEHDVLDEILDDGPGDASDDEHYEVTSCSSAPTSAPTPAFKRVRPTAMTKFQKVAPMPAAKRRRAPAPDTSSSSSSSSAVAAPFITPSLIHSIARQPRDDLDEETQLYSLPPAAAPPAATAPLLTTATADAETQLYDDDTMPPPLVTAAAPLLTTAIPNEDTQQEDAQEWCEPDNDMFTSLVFPVAPQQQHAPAFTIFSDEASVNALPDVPAAPSVVIAEPDVSASVPDVPIAPSVVIAAPDVSASAPDVPTAPPVVIAAPGVHASAPDVPTAPSVVIAAPDVHASVPVVSTIIRLASHLVFYMVSPEPVDKPIRKMAHTSTEARVCSSVKA